MQNQSTNIIAQPICGLQNGQKKGKRDFNMENKRRWTVEENLVYCMCLRDQYESFLSQTERRKEKVFKIMSNKMDNRRTPQQCRGHHKKLMKKYGNMYRLLIEVESEIKVFIGKNPKYKIFGIQAEQFKDILYAHHNEQQEKQDNYAIEAEEDKQCSSELSHSEKEEDGQEWEKYLIFESE